MEAKKSPDQAAELEALRGELEEAAFLLKVVSQQRDHAMDSIAQLNLAVAKARGVVKGRPEPEKKGPPS